MDPPVPDRCGLGRVRRWDFFGWRMYFSWEWMWWGSKCLEPKWWGFNQRLGFDSWLGFDS